MTERGVIRDRTHSNQVKDFSGLRWNNITPTDFDLCLDFGNAVFIIGELKFSGSIFPTGQRLIIERWIDSFTRDGKIAIGFVAQHETRPCDDIDVSRCAVSEYRYKFEWKQTRTPVTVKEFIDWFLNKYAKKYTEI